MSIPLRNFGKTGIQISALGLGGHHLGGAKDEKTAIHIVHRALDGGVTFYGNAWEYYRGKTESWLGLGLKGRRDKVFLMTKVCTHGRDASLATQMLEQSLRRLQTDHLDLWQIHSDPMVGLRGRRNALWNCDFTFPYVGFASRLCRHDCVGFV